MIVAVREPEFHIKNKTLIKYNGSRSYNTIYIPRGVEHIASDAFKEYGYISHIVIPDSVKTIEKNMFLSCGELESVSFLGCPEFSQKFSYESNLKNIYIPSTRDKSDYKIEISPEVIPEQKKRTIWDYPYFDRDLGLTIYEEGPIQEEPSRRYWGEKIYKKKVKIGEDVAKLVNLPVDELAKHKAINKVYAEYNDHARMKYDLGYVQDFFRELEWAENPFPETMTVYETVYKWIEVEVPAPKKPAWRSLSFGQISQETYNWYKDIKVTELKDGVYDSKSRYIRPLD